MTEGPTNAETMTNETRRWQSFAMQPRDSWMRVVDALDAMTEGIARYEVPIGLALLVMGAAGFGALVARLAG